MLDSQTKKRIDTARDILVGKISDPKSQVEQITIALIYKFMDDMDKQSEELGGKAKFFTGEYAPYAWSKIFDPRVSGHDLVVLYGEAIQGMNQNPNIPLLFRSIFKNAYLPYRDPETLKSFLKVISEFEYDHSERLGDAFEYLLSVMGSQGDAGQFRTPRHIIDFMVKAVDPDKNETILDPACGTAGFLISSFKHIQSKNRDKESGKINLTPDEKKRLIENFSGYDISPDMVRLSLVNMYLHGFQNPKIYEYDTLTSEEKWNEYYDVVLANPPFMTPKGGIRPHKRFSVQANRSEVLFVDYIAEHLSVHGRAGVIVPEGIIFQSANAYKALRKMLVDSGYLYAVVSLPSGVFNPYAGVKTSILLIDKTLARKTRNILFVKIENDGFDLGAQRRAIDKNDIPRILDVLSKYKQKVLKGEELIVREEDKTYAHIVAKEKIVASGDYNLSGDRYKETVSFVNQKWPMVELGEVCEIDPTKKELKNINWELDVSFVPMADLLQRQMVFPIKESKKIKDVIKGYTYFRENDVLLAKITPCFENGKSGIARGLTNDLGFGSTEFIVLRHKDHILPEWIYFLISSDSFLKQGKNNMTGSAGQQRLTKNFVENYKIPLPPLEIQEKIVAELDGYQKIIGGAKQIIENYKPTIKIDPSWEMVELGEVCSVQSGGTPSKNKKEYWEHGDIPWVGSTVCKDCFVDRIQQFITKEGLKNSSAKIFKPKTTLIALVGATIGKTAFLMVESATNQNIAGIYPKDDKMLLPEFVFYISQILYREFMNLGSGKFRMANLSFVKSLKIPLPPIDVQQQIVTQIESEQKIINENKKLIEIFEQKIKDKIQEV